MTDNIASIDSEQNSNKYLSFVLAGEIYAISTKFIQEIREFEDIHPLPASPDFVLGLLPQRDRVIAIVDLRKKYNLAQPKPKFRACIIVISVLWDNKQQMVGLYVEEVKDLVSFEVNQIQSLEHIQFAFDAKFLHGLVRQEINESKKRSIILLNIEALFNEAEWQLINEQTP